MFDCITGTVHLSWLHGVSAEKIDSLPLQLPGSLSTDMHIESGLGCAGYLKHLPKKWRV
jgi:hypothetical protein